MDPSCSIPVNPLSPPFGHPILPDSPHVIPISLPTWTQTISYARGDKFECTVALDGYPRLFILRDVHQLASLLERKYGLEAERCMLFPSYRLAEQCTSFVQAKSQNLPSARILSLLVNPQDNHGVQEPAIQPQESTSPASANLHIVFIPSHVLSHADEFWKATGTGISSRLAVHWLSILNEGEDEGAPYVKKGRRWFSVQISNPTSLPFPLPLRKDNDPTRRLKLIEPNYDDNMNLAERYVRDLPVTDGASAKRALLHRISGLLGRGASHTIQEYIPSHNNSAGVSETDIYLFPTCMSAIWHAHQMALAVRPAAKSICFGFIYLRTQSILRNWGPGYHLFPSTTESAVDELEAVLEEEFKRDPTKPPILALYTEFPTNPLLSSADLPRLRALADKYNFLIVVDETLGNLVNVDILPYVDVSVASLTKFFSGGANVKGGSFILNPHGRHYATLKAYMNTHYQDTYFDEDAIRLELNSRNFLHRIQIINTNAEAICDFLYSQSVAACCPNALIKEVFYPKYTTPENYKRCRGASASQGRHRQPAISESNESQSDDSDNDVAYGGLCSLSFSSIVAAEAFYDALSCLKAPTLGFNSTVACPFTMVYHIRELEWAARCGVDEGLVRVSIGMEDREKLLEIFKVALSVARRAVVATATTARREGVKT